MDASRVGVGTDTARRERRAELIGLRRGGGPWSIVLAGGEGERIKPLVLRWLKRAKPKQYCAFVGTRSMLQHTLARADRLSARDRQVIIINRTHLRDAKPQIGDRLVKNVILQPGNRDTAAGVFLPLTYVKARDPEATVVVFPSDHFIYPGESFAEVVAAAVRAAEDLDKLVLLGVVPDRPESDYGWIVPGENIGRVSDHEVSEVRAFVEKPDVAQAGEAMASGGLWNTLVFAVKVKTLWQMGVNCFPRMMKLFSRLASAIDTSRESSVVERIYRVMPVHNFSSALLAHSVHRVAAIELRDVLWSDWGRPERIADTLRRMDKTPAFPWAILGKECQPQSS